MECAICLEEAPNAMLGCGHGFHAECLRQSGKFSQLECPLCPLCRAPVEACEKGLAAVQRYKLSGVLIGDADILKEGAAFGSAQCGLLLGQMYHAGMGVQPDDAVAEQFWEQFDNFSSACNNIAALAHRRGQMGRAEEYYRKALVIKPTAVSHINLADLLAGSEEAIQNYYSAITLYNGDPEERSKKAGVYLLMGNSVYKTRRPVESYPYFRQCIELEPHNVKGLLMTALTCNDVEAAHEYTDRVLAIEFNNADALCMKGRMYALQGNKDGADDMLRRLLRVAPSNKFTEDLVSSMRAKFGPPTRKRARIL